MDKAQDVADWANTRVHALFDAEHDGRGGEHAYRVLHRAFARYIEAHEQPPVDPLLNEAIELVCAENVARTDNQIAAIRSRQAGNDKVALALAALKRGLALAGRGEGE